MVELYQFPWSPYCLVQQRILEYSGVRFKSIAVPSTDRSLIWKLSKQRYYQVPLVKDGRDVLFETDQHSQVIAKYLDAKYELDLFPRKFDGMQRLIWRYIENDVESLTFKLNDVYYQESVPKKEICAYVRHKERSFGDGCMEAWRKDRATMVSQLTETLVPFEQMLATKPYLLDDKPRFVDFDLWGMLANFLYSGHYSLPARHVRLKRWYQRLSKAKHRK